VCDKKLAIAPRFRLRVTFLKLCGQIFRSDSKPISKEVSLVGGFHIGLRESNVRRNTGNCHVLSAARRFREFVLSKISKRHQNPATNRHACGGGGFHVDLLRTSLRQKWTTAETLSAERHFREFVLTIFSERQKPRQQRDLSGGDFLSVCRGRVCAKNW
jgi:hypothetical protein